MELFIAFDAGGLIIAAIVGVVLVFYGVVFGIEDFISYVYSNELKMFEIIVAVVAVIAIIAFFCLREKFTGTSEKFSAFLSIMSVSVCISYTLFYFVNSLISSILDVYDRFNLVLQILLGLIPWLILVLIIQLLILGIPSLAIFGVFEGTSSTKSSFLVCLGGFINVAIATVCAYFAVHPALIGNFNIYEIV